jgi:hypothetical protein
MAFRDWPQVISFSLIQLAIMAVRKVSPRKKHVCARGPFAARFAGVVGSGKNSAYKFVIPPESGE